MNDYETYDEELLYEEDDYEEDDYDDSAEDAERRRRRSSRYRRVRTPPRRGLPRRSGGMALGQRYTSRGPSRSEFETLKRVVAQNQTESRSRTSRNRKDINTSSKAIKTNDRNLRNLRKKQASDTRRLERSDSKLRTLTLLTTLLSPQLTIQRAGIEVREEGSPPEPQIEFVEGNDVVTNVSVQQDLTTLILLLTLGRDTGGKGDDSLTTLLPLLLLTQQQTGNNANNNNALLLALALSDSL
ncbi:MAG: hypothetical protein MI924_18130 [Chloroflexales bacterium]|nr:hypothetical protein [Chloroflexales bacterium]